MAGVNLRIAPLNGSSSGDMDILEIRIKGNKNPFLNFNAGWGYALLLKNLNILKLGMCLNIDPSYIAKGDFILVTASSSDYGEYKVKGSYIGLLLSYSITKAKYLKMR